MGNEYYSPKLAKIKKYCNCRWEGNIDFMDSKHDAIRWLHKVKYFIDLNTKSNLYGCVFVIHDFVIR